MKNKLILQLCIKNIILFLYHCKLFATLFQVSLPDCNHATVVTDFKSYILVFQTHMFVNEKPILINIYLGNT